MHEETILLVNKDVLDAYQKAAEASLQAFKEFSSFHYANCPWCGGESMVEVDDQGHRNYMCLHTHECTYAYAVLLLSALPLE